MTAVVFGATGLVGKELVFELLEDKSFQKVKVVVRNTLPLANKNLEQILINNFSHLDNLTDQLKADAYFCCLGTTIKKAGSQEAFREVDLHIPIRIAKMAEANKVPYLAIISSIGADTKSSNFYLRTKGEMEEQVQTVYTGNLKIARPSLLIGHRNEFRLGEKLAVVITRIISILLIGPLAKYRGIQAAEVARGLIKAKELNNKIFIESDELKNLAGKPTSQTRRHDVIK